MTGLCSLFTSILFLVVVDARKTYLVKSENNLKLQPAVVQATTYDCSWCKF